MAMEQQTQANSTPNAVPQPMMGYAPIQQQLGQTGMGAVPMGYTGVPQQFVPQGFLGNLLGQIGGPVGSAIGGYFGNPQLGQSIGSAAGQIASQYLPFQAQVPGMQVPYSAQVPVMQQNVPQQFVPQGFFNDLMGMILRPPIPVPFPTPISIPIPIPFPSFGNLLPFSAQMAGMQQNIPQQLVPQGFVGNLLGQIGAPVGTAIGGYFGHPQIGGAIGSALGQAATFLPFSAQVPGMQQAVPQQQLVPQGILGNMLGQLIGGPLGGVLGTLLPFSAQVPGMQQAVPPQQLTPQGISWTDLLNLLRPHIPTSPFIPGVPTPPFVLPFSAQVPGMQQAVPQQQLAPQGFLGGLVGGLGGPLGSAIGGYFGHPQLGQTIGSIAGPLAGLLLPFSAQVPGMQQGYGQQGYGQMVPGNGAWGIPPNYYRS